MASGETDAALQWVTLFDNMNKKSKSKDAAKKPDADAVHAKEGGGGGDGKSKKSNKRLSVERIYQKKSQLEHILLRPDTYIGSVEKVTQAMWVYDEAEECMVNREITYVPGLYKIFDEVLVNAADNRQRDPKGMTTIKIDIDSESNKIKIWNNGKGIPVVMHKEQNMYVPTLIFGHLLTSSNYDDSEKKVTGGRNGYGAKLCNIFSNKFQLETQSNDYKKAFKQTWTENMLKATEPKIVASKGEDYTAVTFYPDLTKFKMEKLDKDIVDLFTRRAYDMVAACKGIKVYLNGKKIGIKNFKEYIELFTKNKVDESGAPLKVVHEIVNERWEVAIALSEKGFQQVSFANCIATTKGGRHVDYINDQVVHKLIEVVKKKEKKGGIAIKPFQVKNHLWLFVNCLIENPSFDSQTKENMTLQAKSFGSKCAVSEKFINQASKSGIIDAIQSWMRFKQQTQLGKKMTSAKTSKLKGIPKLDDANNAGTKNSGDCTLILTEGDSAKTLAVSGLGVIGRDKYGVFPLRGKVLNVREASHKQIMENAEINNLIKILGLRYKEAYATPESLKSLRYGKMMIMTDQDQDGSHIKGLLINFIHHNWPNLLKHCFVEEFITPIVKVSKKNSERSFYSLPEFEEWKKETDNWHTYKVKYYKGLGTSTSKEAKDYFSDMKRHRVPFKYQGPEDDSSIMLAFSKKKIEERKEWLTNWMEERKRRKQLGLPELFLYGKETRHITYNEFVNRELILFSNMDNERSIPNLVDGFKPGQRKVMFTCFKRNLIKEIKVAQLAGSVSEMSAYHHGEASLMGTIINLAQNYVGSNNINLLQPIGQFGTRLNGGKDAASPRYIFTALSTLTRHLFNVNDEYLLKPNFDDNQRIEPEWYIPIIPMVLVNGAEGIGTGWSTRIPNFDPRAIVANLQRMLNGEESRPMVPYYKNFNGTIDTIDETRYVTTGEINILDDQTVEIIELPIRTWTQNYKESVLEIMLSGTEKLPPCITDYKEYHTDTTVRFVVKMTSEKLARAEEEGLHKFFKLQTSMSVSSMVLFDSLGCIRRYDNVNQILQEFYHLRLDFYQRRKDYLEGQLAAESLKLDNIARFILEKIEGKIVIENKPKKEIIQMLVRRGFDSDPLKTWKDAQHKLQENEEEPEEEEGGDAASEASSVRDGGPDFNYLLNLPMWCLTKERKDELLKQRDTKSEALYQLRRKTNSDLWKDDLNAFLEELNKVEKQEREDEAQGVKKLAGKAAPKGRVKKLVANETRPSPTGRRVEPVIDPALRAKSAAAATKKRKDKVKKEAGLNFDDDDMGDDDAEPKSLAERLGAANSPIGKNKKVKTEKSGKGKQQSLASAFGKTKPATKKLGRAKQEMLGSDSEDEPVEIDDDSEDSDEMFGGRLPNGKRKQNGIDSDGDSSVSPSPKKTKVVGQIKTIGEAKKRGAAKVPRKKKGGGYAEPNFSDLDRSDISDMEDQLIVKKKRQPFDSDSEDDGHKRKRHNSDDDDLSFDLKVAPHERSGGRSRKAVRYNVDESDDDDVSDVEDYLPVQRAPARAPAAKKPAAIESESEGEEEGEKLNGDVTSSPTESKSSAPIAIESDESDESDYIASPSSESAPPTPEPAPKVKKPAAPRAKKASGDGEKKKRPKPTVISDDDDDLSDEDSFKPKKPAAKKPRKKADPFAAAKKTKAPKKKAISDDDDDDFEDDADFDMPVVSRGGGGARARAPVKYNFEESDDDDDDML